MNELKEIYHEVEALKDYDSYTPYQRQCNKILNMIERLLVMDDNLLQKLWNAFYEEEDKWEQLLVGTSNHDNWFTTYRPWLQEGFGIAIKVLSQEINENGNE